jgi:hypothetical protein
VRGHRIGVGDLIISQRNDPTIGVYDATDIAPPDQCSLNAVRPGQTFSRTDSGVPGADIGIVTTVTPRPSTST